MDPREEARLQEKVQGGGGDKNLVQDYLQVVPIGNKGGGKDRQNQKQHYVPARGS